MATGLQDSKQLWCDSCAKAAQAFFNRLSTASTENTRIWSPIFSVNTALNGPDIDNGCRLCNLLRICIRREFLDPKLMEIKLRLSKTKPYFVWIENAEILSEFQKDRGTAIMDSFCNRKISEPGSDRILNAIVQWARECDEKHAQCRVGKQSGPSMANPKLPTRVLDVGNEDESPYLLVSNGLTGEYVALSHCWGGYSQNMTTKATYKANQQRIDMASLPKTFQDAIKVTRQLGIRYIWIDSLCIIQDDEHDWYREAEKMGLVYEHAYCTIAAAAAADGSIGCFVQEGEGDPMVLLPSHGSALVDTGNVYLARPSANTHFDTGPLFSRAWVVQERLLSPRVLHFAQDQVYWECRKQILSEDGAAVKESQFGKLREWFFTGIQAGPNGPSVTNPIGEPVTSSSEIWFVNFWSEFVQFFSRKNLTVPSDKIPALRGIAQRLAVATNLKFIAGLFFDDAPTALRALMWRRGEQFLVTNGSKVPSWSWASLDGYIVYQCSLDQEDGVVFRAPSTMPLSPIAKIVNLPIDGSRTQSLEIAAPIASAGKGEPHCNGVTRTMGCQVHCFQLIDNCFRVLCNSQSTRLTYQSKVCFDTKDCQPGSFFIVPLFEDKPGHELPHSHRKHVHVYNIAVERQIDDRGLEVYRRIGMALTLRDKDDVFPEVRTIRLV
ncbi:HET-domain-containing protein [Paramyrothecium foliicola]|nr:HET-domain-containing protein [Paramyrothecium foliicola]